MPVSVMDKLASSLGRNDEVPNQELARELCRTGDRNSIHELVQLLFSGSAAIQNDSIKVLYEIGEVQPELIADDVEAFIRLLTSKNNRLIWGAMTALSTIAPIRAYKIYENVDLIFKAIKQGSVITVDNGVSVLAKVGSVKNEYETVILPFLLDHLASCKPREVAQHSERSMIIANTGNKVHFIQVLEQRMQDLTPAQQVRVKKVIKKVGGL
ncbi:MAG TPA: hypothetical protein VF531_00570 [Bacillota bacterium]